VNMWSEPIQTQNIHLQSCMPL